MEKFQSYKIILGSQSPRRQELLASLGLNFEVRVPGFAEIMQTGESAPDYVQRNAIGKAKWIESHLISQNELMGPHKTIVISADTVVTIDGCTLEKPQNSEEAFTMLSRLSGRTHTVHTGLCVLGLHQNHRNTRSLLVSTDVTFKTLSAEEITRYIASKDPFDKAGSYGIQGLGAYLVQSLKGSYTSVMGLPLSELYECLHTDF